MSDTDKAMTRNRVKPCGTVAREADGWAVVDADGALVAMTAAPTRIEAIKCRVFMMGAAVHGNVTDEAVEAWWREHTDPIEDVVAVRVTALLN